MLCSILLVLCTSFNWYSKTLPKLYYRLQNRKEVAVNVLRNLEKSDVKKIKQDGIEIILHKVERV